LYADLLPKLAGEAPLSAREAAALDFARRLAASHPAIDDPFLERMRQQFTDAEVVELGLITGAFLMLGRLHRAFGVAPMGPRSHTVLEKG